MINTPSTPKKTLRTAQTNGNDHFFQTERLYVFAPSKPVPPKGRMDPTVSSKSLRVRYNNKVCCAWTRNKNRENAENCGGYCMEIKGVLPCIWPKKPMENVVTLWGENGPKFVQHHAPTYVWVVFCDIYLRVSLPDPPLHNSLTLGIIIVLPWAIMNMDSFVEEAFMHVYNSPSCTSV